MGEQDGQPKDPEWAGAVCGIPANTIRKLARRMAAKRTLITASWSLQRADHGEQPYWMAAVLAAILGEIGIPGGGIGYGYGSTGSIGNPVRSVSGMALPQGANPVKAFIPVARITDMLLNPGEPFDYNGQRLRYPDIRLVYWCGGQPLSSPPGPQPAGGGMAASGNDHRPRALVEPSSAACRHRAAGHHLPGTQRHRLAAGRSHGIRHGSGNPSGR